VRTARPETRPEVPAVPFHYVDLRTFSYVTEDDRKVETALRRLLPEEFDLDRAESEGHHGDRIVVLSARVENADDVRTVLDALADADLGVVVAELDDRVAEDCSLYCSVDKAGAYRGEVRWGEGISVRAKVEAYPADRETAVENAREGLEPYLE
jgi:RNA binding exosome subunit